MSLVGAIGRKLDDWLNPIAVKELRQAVQAKLIAGLLLLFLVGLLVTTLAMASARSGRGYDAESTGGDVFIVLYGILLGTCTVLVPAYCGGRLTAERSGAHADLLFATALRPRSIVWGKFSSGLILIVLIYSACAPFLTLTYLLRGIDMSVIFILLGFGLVLGALSLMSALFLACVPTTNPLRGLLGLVWLGLTFYLLLYFMRGAIGFIEYGGGVLGSVFWVVVVTPTVFALIATGFLFVVSVTLMSPPSANRIMPLRVYVTIAWLLTGTGAYLTLQSIEWVALPFGWATFCIIMFCGALLVAVSERDRIGPRITRTIPRSSLLRPVAFLFYTGSARGVLWSCLMLGLTLFALHHFDGTALSTRLYPRAVVDERTPRMLGLAVYAFAYAMTGYVLQRYLVPRAGTGQTWMLALCVAAVAFLLPIGSQLLQSDPFRDRQMSPLWALGTPMLVFDDDYRDAAMTFSQAWAVIVFLLALPRLWRQVAAFQPLGSSRPAAAREQAAGAPSAVVEAQIEPEAGPS